MRTASCKAKGRRACSEVRELLLEYAPEIQGDDIRVTPSGVTGEDILMSPLAYSIYPLIIECKNQESLNIWKSLDQSKSHVTSQKIQTTSGSERTPALCFRRNRSNLYIAMELEDFLKLYRGKKSA